jgi:hypothetical protein
MWDMVSKQNRAILLCPRKNSCKRKDRRMIAGKMITNWMEIMTTAKKRRIPLWKATDSVATCRTRNLSLSTTFKPKVNLRRESEFKGKGNSNKG